MRHELEVLAAKPSVSPRAPTRREEPSVPNPLPKRFPERQPVETPRISPVRAPELVPAK